MTRSNQTSIFARKLENKFKRLVKSIVFPMTNVLPNPDSAQKEHEWSIGMYTGKSPLNLTSPEGLKNPILTRQDVIDVHAAFVADPFIVKVNNIWHMFFEIANIESHKGEIGFAISDDGLKWTYQRIVLTESFHLSYPYVFDWMGDYYMIPESHEAKAVRLYQATEFPTQWRFVANLIDGLTFNDPSIFRHNDKWWLFVETEPALQCDTLRLYHADELMGPWLEHPMSPIINGDAHIARPAGRVLAIGDCIIRYTQDCYPIYGTQVRAFKITELTTTSYREREVSESPILTPSGIGWNEFGMHHIDPHPLENGNWIACVDGFSWQ